jgi:hypothetical protein
MKKSGTNALWNKLSASQLEKLDHWLFVERLGCKAAWSQARAELGFEGSVGSLQRYRTRRRKERTTEEFKELRDEMAEINAAPGDVASQREALKKLMGKFLFLQMQQAPEKVKEWAPVASLMAQTEYNEVLRDAKTEEHKIRRNAMAFAREKFEFDTMERALKALPQLRELAEAKKDPLTQEYEENAYWNRVRRVMFRAQNVHPESAQEEAEMLAAKKEREARREREAQAEAEQERIIGAQPPPPSSQYHQEYIAKRVKQEEENWEMCGEFEI